MRGFTVIQNVLTAIVIPFLAVIVGISSVPAIYLFLFILELGGVEASSFSEIDSVSLLDFLIFGMGLGDGNNVLGSDSGNPIGGTGRTIPSKTRAWQVPSAIIRNNTMGLVYDIPQNCPVLPALSCSFIHRKHVLPTLGG